MDRNSFGYRNLKVYQTAYKLAMEIFQLTKAFPAEEKYSLTDQMRRSSRSVVANIAEAYRHRNYARLFVHKLTIADGETTETQIWLDFARDCGYLDSEKHENLLNLYEEVGKMLGSMISHPERFSASSQKPA
jgi:four helix bundle protein